MLATTRVLPEEQGLRAVDAVFDVARADLFDLYTESGYREERKEVCLRKDFRPSVFE